MLKQCAGRQPRGVPDGGNLETRGGGEGFDKKRVVVLPPLCSPFLKNRKKEIKRSFPSRLATIRITDLLLGSARSQRQKVRFLFLSFPFRL